MRVGPTLATRVADRLDTGDVLVYAHRDYCGMGLAKDGDLYLYDAVNDGDPPTRAAGPQSSSERQVFAGRLPFVDWLSEQSDASLSGQDLEDSFLRHNQRLTLERLERFAAGASPAAIRALDEGDAATGSGWRFVLMTTLLLFGGLELADLLLLSPPPVDAGLSDVPIGLFLAVAIPVGILEGLFWTVGCIELAARWLRSASVGAVIGIVGYGAVFHWSGGALAILVSTWIVLVLNVGYLLLRSRSRRTAVISTLAHKVLFMLYAAHGIYIATP